MSVDDKVLRRYEPFHSHCAHLGDAEILDLEVRDGLPVITGAKIYRRVHLDDVKRAFSRTERRRFRCAAADAFTKLGNGTVPRIEIVAGVPVKLWLKEG